MWRVWLVKQILLEHKGNEAVYIYLTETRRKLAAPKNLFVNVTDTLLERLSSVLGAENVKMVK